MASPYASQLSQISSLRGANMSADMNRETAAYNLAKLEYQNELKRQKKEMQKKKEKHEGAWWKRGLGSALTGAVTGGLAGIAGGPAGIAGGALAGAGAGFIGSAVNDKLLDEEMGPGFGMQMGSAVGSGVAGAVTDSQAKLGLADDPRLSGIEDDILSGRPGYENYRGYSSLGANGSHYAQPFVGPPSNLANTDPQDQARRMLMMARQQAMQQGANPYGAPMSGGGNYGYGPSY